jgi:hypothetical protein
VIRRQTALGEQFFYIAERQRIAKIPAHGTQNQLRRRLPPLEDCRSGCLLHDLFRLPANPAKVATHPSSAFFKVATLPGRQYRAIADALEGIDGRGVEQLAGLPIAERAGVLPSLLLGLDRKYPRSYSFLGL